METKTLSIRYDTKRFAQFARRLVGAELQQITYREFLPVALGEKALGDLASVETTYDQNVDPSILNEFATVAFRLSFNAIDKKEWISFQVWTLDHS